MLDIRLVGSSLHPLGPAILNLSIHLKTFFPPESMTLKHGCQAATIMGKYQVAVTAQIINPGASISDIMKIIQPNTCTH